MDLFAWSCVVLLSGFVVTFLAIPFMKEAALKWGVVSRPGGRRFHARQTPLLGGAAIYIPFAMVFLAAFVLLLSGRVSFVELGDWEMVSLFLGATWMLALGTVDDKVTLGWKKKLTGQFLGVGILVLGGHTIALTTIPYVGLVDFGRLGIPLFMASVIVITNAVNLIDGLDGLAGGICFFAALTCSVIAVVKGDMFTAMVGFAISGALVGFLVYNFPPASLFMGDGGSMMLGFVLGTLATSSAAGWPGQRLGTSLVIVVAFLPFGIPLFEVALSILRRLIRGQAIFMGDGNHLHHRLMAKIQNPRLTVAVFYVFSAALCLLTLLAVLEVQSRGLRLLMTVVEVFLFVGVVASIKLYQVEGLLVTLKRRPHFKFLVQFDKFMRQRLRRVKSGQELVSLLESGVRDLEFDQVEVFHGGESLVKWVNPRPVHPESPRVHAEETFSWAKVTVKWSRPIHEDRSYNELLMLTWYRFLERLRGEIPDHAWDFAKPGKDNVVDLVRRTSE